MGGLQPRVNSPNKLDQDVIPKPARIDDCREQIGCINTFVNLSGALYNYTGVKISDKRELAEK